MKSTCFQVAVLNIYIYMIFANFIYIYIENKNVQEYGKIHLKTNMQRNSQKWFQCVYDFFEISLHVSLHLGNSTGVIRSNSFVRRAPPPGLPYVQIKVFYMASSIKTFTAFVLNAKLTQFSAFSRGTAINRYYT